jgi:hypothetical protein
MVTKEGNSCQPTIHAVNAYSCQSELLEVERTHAELSLGGLQNILGLFQH